MERNLPPDGRPQMRPIRPVATKNTDELRNTGNQMNRHIAETASTSIGPITTTVVRD